MMERLFCVLVCLAVALENNAAVGKTDVLNKRSNLASNPSLTPFLNKRKESTSLALPAKRGGKLGKRGFNSEDVKEECCDKSCVFEERAEFAESHSHEWVSETLCEVSIREGDRTCWCKANAGYWYECGIGRCVPCQKSQFHCGGSWHDKTNCVAGYKRCDSNNDCGSWQDEPEGCKFKAGLPISLSNGHFGKVMIGGRPACDDYWDDNDARVVCRNLGYTNDVTAIATQGNLFGTVSNNFMIDNARCTGTEEKLYMCTYLTKHNCNTNEGAGVICVDAKNLDLKDGNKALRYGNVYIDNAPVCQNGWDTNDAQVVCNYLFKTDFIERGGKVPVFAFTTGSEFGPPNTDDFVMDQVNCAGTETLLNQCTFVTHNRETCDRSQAAGVKCAKCTKTDLLNILNLARVGGTVERSKLNVNEALSRLSSQCYAWDCDVAEGKQVYEEYCLVRASLIEYKGILSQKFRKEALVSVKFHPGKLLQHHFTIEQTNDVMAKIERLGQQTADFQRKMAGYFTTMASFDRDKAIADHKYAYGVWNTQRQQVKKIQRELVPALTTLFDYAFDASALAIGDRVAQLALAVASLASPADAVFNPGEMAEKASNILSRAGDLADTIADNEELRYIFGTTYPRFKTLSQELETKYAGNKNTYDAIAGIVQISGMQAFTPEKARQFLTAYDNYSPAITIDQLTEYKFLIDDIVTKVCEMIQKPGDGPAKVVVRMKCIKLCPEAKKKVEILKALLEETKDTQMDVMDAFADYARAKVSEMAAQELSNVLNRPIDGGYNRVIDAKKAAYLFQMHKAFLIENACDYIRYIYYGVEQEICKTLRGNTAGDIGPLVSFNYRDNIMCKHPKRGTFNIPATTRRAGETVPKGTLDLTQLLDPSDDDSAMLFQIPDSKWLVDNGWIDADESQNGPFFVKKFQLYPLPTLSWKITDVRTRLFLISNKVGNEVFLFDDSVQAYFEMEEKNVNCDAAHVLKSPYNNQMCQPAGNLCARADGNFQGPVYPSLLSIWSVQLKIARAYRRELPFPEGPFNLKVKAEICYRQSPAKKEVQKQANAKKCCADSNQYFDDDQSCQDCAAGSTSRLNGYYCETCPIGYEPISPGANAYGCQLCPENTYKDQIGNSRCIPCGAGLTTGGIKGSALCTAPVPPTTS